jgi:hypothetical protein
MAEIEDRLVPQDGLNNYNIVLSRMELPTHGSARFTFALTDSMLSVAELHVNIPASSQGLDRMTVTAHDAVIDILRQLVFRADKARATHEKNAKPLSLAIPKPVNDEMEFMKERPSQVSFAVVEDFGSLS